MILAVARADLPATQQVLAALAAENAPEGSHESETDGSACPACMTSIPAEAEECPDCGIRLR
ncbi:MAG: hypothetical protein ACPG1Z_06165 [Planctomycetota bacterium]